MNNDKATGEKDPNELSDAELDGVSGGLAADAVSQIKTVIKAMKAAPQSDGKPIGDQAYPSSGAATKA